jgi:hypothetical protein
LGLLELISKGNYFWYYLFVETKWFTDEIPSDGTYVLLTLSEDGDHWVEPGQYNGRFTDIHRVPFRETIVAWMPFPPPYTNE